MREQLSDTQLVEGLSPFRSIWELLTFSETYSIIKYVSDNWVREPKADGLEAKGHGLWPVCFYGG